MSLFLYTAGEPERLALLQESCSRVNLPLHSYHVEWSSWSRIKAQEGRKFLEAHCPPGAIAMWVDGYDSLVVQPEAVILERWRWLGGGLVIASEMNCWPQPEWASDYPEAPGNRYLCAGGYIGPRDELIDALALVERLSSDGNDQTGWTIAYLEKCFPLKIDHESQLFRSMNSPAHTDSCVYHWNGKLPGREEWWRSYASEPR